MRSGVKLAVAAALFALAGVATAHSQPAGAPPALAPSSPASPACVFKKVADVRVDTSHGVPRIPVIANGQRRWIEVNTAQFISTLHKSDIAALGGARQPDPPLVRTDGNHVQHSVKRYLLKNVIFGDGLGIANFEFTEMDDEPTKSDVVGFIGIDLLAKGDVELDLAHNRIAFFNTRNCGQLGLAYWGGPIDTAPMLLPENPLFRHEFDPQVSLNGHTVRAVLATAAPVSEVSADFAVEQGLTSGDPRVKAITGYAQPITAAKFDAFTIGGEKISNPTLTVIPFADVVSAPGLEGLKKVKVQHAMLLGRDFLMSHRVLLATSQNTMYFSYNGGPVFQTPRSK